jgi:hypothetical protein
MSSMPTAVAPPTETTTVTGQGTVRAIIAVTGVVDAVGDLIEPGAFGDVSRRRIKLCAHHDPQRPIGKVTAAIELRPGDRRLPARTADGNPWPREAGALVITARLNLATTGGREAFEELRFFGEDGSWSIGYVVPPGGAVPRGKVRRVRKLDLLHASTTLHGANHLARTIEVKSLRRTETKALPTRRRTTRDRARQALYDQIRAEAAAYSSSSRLDEMDRLRAERVRQQVRRYDREKAAADGDERESYAEVVARDVNYHMDAAGVMYRVLPCHRCSRDVFLELGGPLPAKTRVRCEQCKDRR